MLVPSLYVKRHLPYSWTIIGLYYFIITYGQQLFTTRDFFHKIIPHLSRNPQIVISSFQATRAIDQVVEHPMHF